jgi:hypothetical protein
MNVMNVKLVKGVVKVYELCEYVIYLSSVYLHLNVNQ